MLKGIGNAVKVMRITTGEDGEDLPPVAKAAAQTRQAGRRCQG